MLNRGNDNYINYSVLIQLHKHNEVLIITYKILST